MPYSPQEDLQQAGKKLQITVADLTAAQEELDGLHAQHREATQTLVEAREKLRSLNEQAQQVPPLKQRVDELEHQLQERETVLSDVQVIQQSSHCRPVLRVAATNSPDLTPFSVPALPAIKFESVHHHAQKLSRALFGSWVRTSTAQCLALRLLDV